MTPGRYQICANDRSLIEEALTAGRVQYLPPGYACGVTTWEAMLHTAYPTITANDNLTPEQEKAMRGRIALMVRRRQINRVR